MPKKLKVDQSTETGTQMTPKTPLDILTKIKREEYVERKPPRKNIIINMSETDDFETEKFAEEFEKEIAKILPETMEAKPKPKKVKPLEPKVETEEAPVEEDSEESIKEISSKASDIQAKSKDFADHLNSVQIVPKKIKRLKPLAVEPTKVSEAPLNEPKKIRAAKTLTKTKEISPRASEARPKAKSAGVKSSPNISTHTVEMTPTGHETSDITIEDTVPLTSGKKLSAQEILDLQPKELLAKVSVQSETGDESKRDAHNLLKELKIITAILLGKNKNKELSQVLDTDKSFTSKQIKGLEEKGLVKREGEGREVSYEVDKFNVMKFLESKIVVRWKKGDLEKDSKEKENGGVKKDGQ